MAHGWLILLGMALLLGGGEALVRGAQKGALRLGMTPLVAGLTVAAFATSMPEAAASFYAQLIGHQGNIALGNVIGSNIANVGLILGVAALIRPIEIHRHMRKREMPLMVGSLLVLALLMLSDQLGHWSGISMLILLVGYVWLQVRNGLREHATDPAAQKHKLPRSRKAFAIDVGWIVLGGVLLVVGGSFLVEGASGLATRLGVPPRIVGLTVVALGTSLPELATSAIASIRKHSDLALGNVVGSNVFNALFIAGGVAALSPISFSTRLLYVDVPVMIGFSLLLWILMAGRRIIGRLSGALLLLCYVAYIVLTVIGS